MFGTHDLWLFIISGLLLNITPGVDTLYIISRSSAQGFRILRETSQNLRLTYPPKRIFRIIESLVHFRTSWTKIPYGDQAHFFTSSFFKTLGCYTPIPLMEDIDIMKRVRGEGEKVTLLEEKVLTSARRWEKEGVFYTTLRNRVLSLLYYVGVAPSKLLKYYPF